jgi:hypothetical protein
MVPDGVLAAWRNQRGETGDKLFTFEAECRGPVAPRVA